MTVRQLIIMRHAKSSWKSEAESDHERPLNNRGRRDAPAVGARLVELGWTPERVLSSDAMRTRETFKRLLMAFDPPPEVEWLRSFYLGGSNEVREEVSLLANSVTSVLCLGHNFGWEETVHWLSGVSVTLTTANAARLETEANSWAEAMDQTGRWRLVDVIRPKEL